MITEHGAKRAMRTLREAGFRVDESTLPAMAQRWVEAANTHGTLTDDSIVSAAERYIAEDHPLHHWPSIGQLQRCASEIANTTDSRYYSEPEPKAQKASPEQVRAAWSEHVDLTELERANRAMRSRRGSSE